MFTSTEIFERLEEIKQSISVLMEELYDSVDYYKFGIVEQMGLEVSSLVSIIEREAEEKKLKEENNEQ
jgi:hypothetical protein